MDNIELAKFMLKDDIHTLKNLSDEELDTIKTVRELLDNNQPIDLIKKQIDEF